MSEKTNQVRMIIPNISPDQIASFKLGNEVEAKVNDPTLIEYKNKWFRGVIIEVRTDSIVAEGEFVDLQ